MVETHAHVAARSAVFVRAVQERLSHPQLRKEILTLLLLSRIRTARLRERVRFTSQHDIVIHMHFLTAPVHRRDQHDQRGIDVPFPRTQEPQEQRVGVIVFGHAPEGFAQLCGGLRRERLLEFFGLAVFVVAAVVVAG